MSWAAFTRTRFHDPPKPRQNRCGLEVFTRNRFRQKSKSSWYKQSLHYVLNSPFRIEQCKFPAKIVTVFKSMRFCCLHDRWNRIVLKTLHFWQPVSSPCTKAEMDKCARCRWLSRTAAWTVKAGELVKCATWKDPFRNWCSWHQHASRDRESPGRGAYHWGRTVSADSRLYSDVITPNILSYSYISSN